MSTMGQQHFHHLPAVAAHSQLQGAAAISTHSIDSCVCLNQKQGSSSMPRRTGQVQGSGTAGGFLLIHLRTCCQEQLHLPCQPQVSSQVPGRPPLAAGSHHIRALIQQRRHHTIAAAHDSYLQDQVDIPECHTSLLGMC
jgi:hypothetical protein